MELYQFQREDVDKILPRGHGLIGSEMGTGKTHEGIQLDLEWWKKGVGPTLVVAPLNTLESWRNKYTMQSPETDVYMIDRKNREAFIRAARKGCDVLLTHWESLRLMPELREIRFNLIIGDEIHRIANRKAQVTRALKSLPAKHRLAMSGTASGDKPENLWSALNWLWPTYYRSYWKFRRYYCVEQRAQGGYFQIVGVRNIDELMREMRPWYVRHLKREACCDHHPNGVMSWLADKLYDTMWIELSPQQRKMYDQMRKHMVAWVGDHEDEPLTAGVVVAQLTRLSQMALATPYLDDDSRVRLKLPSSKLDAVLERVKEDPNKKFVIYSSSKKICYLAQDFFKEKGIESVVLSGDTPDTQRRGMVERFATSNVQLFIGVIEAAAEGIDGLQHASDTAIFLDRSWRTIKNKQAEDRLHRDGQLNAVEIIDIVARNTIDLGRNQQLLTKWNWIKAILGDKFDNTEVNLASLLQDGNN